MANQREDRWGRLKTVAAFLRSKSLKERAQVGEKFIICFRLSLLDLVHDGNTMKEVVTIAQALEKQALPFIEYRDWFGMKRGFQLLL